MSGSNGLTNLSGNPQAYQAPQNNLLGQYGDVVGLQNSLLQQKVLAQQPAIQQQELSNMQTQGSGMNQDQAIQRAQYINTTLQGLLGKGSALQPSDVISAAGGAVAAGVVTPQQTTQMLSDLPTTPGPALQQWVKNHIMNSGNVAQALQATNGSPDVLNNGATQSVVSVNPNTNSVTPLAGGTFNNQLSPDAATAPTQIGTNPQTGQPIMGTRQQYAQNAQPPGPLGTGRYQTPGTQAQPGGGIPMGLPVGTSEAMGVTAQNSAQQYANMTNQLSSIPTQKNALETLKGTLTSPGGFTSGPGATEFAQTLAGFNRVFGTNLDQNGIASTELFNKTAQTLVNQQTSMLGAGTNEKIEATMAATPNSHLSTPGAIQIIDKLMGNQDFVQAYNQAGLSYMAKNGPASYPQFVAQATQTMDPLAFQLHNMNPEEQKAALSSLSPAELSTFRQKYNAMSGMGMFQQYQQPAQPASVPNPSAPGQAYVPAVAPQVPVTQ